MKDPLFHTKYEYERGSCDVNSPIQKNTFCFYNPHNPRYYLYFGVLLSTWLLEPHQMQIDSVRVYTSYAAMGIHAYYSNVVIMRHTREITPHTCLTGTDCTDV